MTSHMQSRDGLLYVHLSGPASFDETTEVINAILDTAAANRCERLLINCSGLQAQYTTVQRFQIGDESASRLHRHKHYPRIALIGSPPAIDGFAVLVGRNRGREARHFAEEAAGVEWLQLP